MRCFVMMPFMSELNDVYQTVKHTIETAIPNENIECYRLDEIRSAGRISDDLLKELSEASICIADVTGNNPNVMLELGYALAQHKPILLLTQRVEDLPFDIRDMRAIQYSRDDLHSTLSHNLSIAFRETVAKYEVRVDRASAPMPKATPRTIAITGSTNGNEAKCRRRIESLLEPYLDDRTTWLCGSNGLADECAVEYLVSRKQLTYVVGYDSFDVSGVMLQIIEKHSLQFIAANKEQLPRGFNDPLHSGRDLLFLTKADLFIALWNGQSKGTKELIDWYSQHEKDAIIGFF